MEELKKYLTSRDISASDVTKAVVIHEVLGVSVMVTAWAACWAVKPSKRLLNILQIRKSVQWTKAQEKMQKSNLLKRIRESKYVSSETATSLGIAFGESYFLRKLCMPILVPLKLWLTYELLILSRNSARESENNV